MTETAERTEMTGKGLNGNALKWIAITAMLIDHIAWSFVPTYSMLGQIMHIIGRITAPTMCFFIVEGYYHTHDVKKYALRLGIFALISQIPYTFHESGQIIPHFGPTGFSVIFTLLCSLLAIWAWDKIENRALKVAALVGLCVLGTLGDWVFLDVLFSLAFAANRGNFKKQAVWFAIITAGMLVMLAVTSTNPCKILMQAGVLLSLPLLALYNGQRGGGKYSKWVFYIFYPTHLLILGLIKWVILK